MMEVGDDVGVDILVDLGSFGFQPSELFQRVCIYHMIRAFAQAGWLLTLIGMDDCRLHQRPRLKASQAQEGI